MDADKVEAWAWAIVMDRLQHPEVLAAELERQREEGPDPLLTDDLEKAMRMVAELKNKQRKVARRYAERDEEEDDGMPWEVIKGELKALEKQRTEWEATATRLEARLAQERAQLTDLEWLYAYCERMRNRLAEANWDEQRTALQALAVRVRANGQDWHIAGIIPLERVPHDIAVVSQTC